MLNKLLGGPSVFSIILISWKSPGELHVTVAEHTLPLIIWPLRGHRWIVCQLPSLAENDCSHGFSVELTYLCMFPFSVLGVHLNPCCYAEKPIILQIPWGKCDVIIWPCQQWQNFQSLGGEKEEEGVKNEVHTLSNLDYLFLLLIFDWHGDHCWLRCMTLKSKRWLRSRYKWPGYEELQFSCWSWPLFMFLQLWGVSKDMAGEALCQVRICSPGRDPFN